MHPDPATDWQRSKPDVVVYGPRGEGHHDTDNEHFLVFESPMGDELLAMWTQSSCEGRGDNHAVFCRSAVGAFRPSAHQPVWFSQPKQILDTDGIPIGPKGTAEIATYTSLTEWRGKRVLWYPDRKYYLLGKVLPDALLADMTVG